MQNHLRTDLVGLLACIAVEVMREVGAMNLVDFGFRRSHNYGERALSVVESALAAEDLALFKVAENVTKLVAVRDAGPYALPRQSEWIKYLAHASVHDVEVVADISQLNEHVSSRAQLFLEIYFEIFDLTPLQQPEPRDVSNQELYLLFARRELGL